jgi:hypothetical protein
VQCRLIHRVSQRSIGLLAVYTDQHMGLTKSGTQQAYPQPPPAQQVLMDIKNSATNKQVAKAIYTNCSKAASLAPYTL